MPTATEDGTPVADRYRPARLHARRLIRVLLAALLFGWPPTTSAQSFARGRIVAGVAELSGRGTYALYLPSGYDPARAWPIVYVLDPRGRSVSAAERFRAAAERFGYILASSNESRSDITPDPNLRALAGLVADTERRFTLDRRRFYIAGFSGTARFAIALARASRRKIVAGIVASGAGYPFGTAPRPSDDFALYAAIGDGDFNWSELMQLEPKLKAARIAHVLDTFAGGHDWAPAEMAARALGWFDLGAMRDGRKPREAGEIEAIWREWVAHAEALSASGDLIAAHDAWTAIAASFAGLRDTGLAAQRASALAADPKLDAALRLRRRLVARDRADLMRASLAFAMDDVERAASALRIDDLRRRAEDGSPAEAAAARRMLAHIGGQTGHYLLETAIRSRDWDRALFYLSVALRADPGRPWLLYSRAAIYARSGEPGRALVDLGAAVANGFADARRLREDPDFAALRGTKGFRVLVAKLDASGAT